MVDNKPKAHCEQEACRYEIVLWCALNYALEIDETETAIAVSETIKSRVGYLSDHTLRKMGGEIAEYIAGAGLMNDGNFVPEWSGARDAIWNEIRRREGNV